MPRPLPLFGDKLAEGCQLLRNFARRIEQNHDVVIAPNVGLTRSGVELTYELLYLKAFLLWEGFQQDVFLRLMMGFESNGGQETLLPGISRFRSLLDAENALLGGKHYQLWHDPAQVMKRSDRFFESSTSYFRGVIGSNQAGLVNYAATRHHIAHSQSHARTEFDNTTMSMSGKRYNGRAGKFLRDRDPLGRRWFEVIIEDFADIAHQIC